MKYTKIAVWGLASAGLGIGVGCSDSTVIFDPSFDGSVVVDSTLPRPDALADTGMPNETGTPDGATPDGATPDSSTPDSSTPDSAVDGGSHVVSSDAGDGGVIVTLVYAENVASALCSNLASCCPGAFATTKCENFLKRGGLDNVWQGLEVSGVSTSGRVTIDNALSAECFALISATNLCRPMGGATSRALMAKCGGAVKGTVAVAGACHADVECLAGNYCAGMNAGAAVEGVCTPTSAAGASCDYGRSGYNGRVTNCSTRGQGDNGRYCTIGAGATCVPLLPAGAACNANFECANQYCTYNPAGTATMCGDAPLDQGLCYFGQ